MTRCEAMNMNGARSRLCSAGELVNIKHKTIDRVRITGPMTEIGKALDYCDRNDYRVTCRGPKMIGPGRADVRRFAITAERIMPNRAICVNASNEEQQCTK